MRVYCNGTAIIRSNLDDRAYSIQSQDLVWDLVDADERQMGAELHYEASLDHPDLGSLTWGLWEYPTGVQNQNETNVGLHTIVRDFDYGLMHEAREDDDL